MAKNSSPQPKRKSAFPLPYAGFPLYPHTGTGLWAKTIRGKRYYFGKLADPDAALKRWNAERDFLMAGQTPPTRVHDGGLTLAHLCNRWLTARLEDMNTGELAPRSFDDYRIIVEQIADTLGRHTHVALLRPDDFRRLVLAARKRSSSPTSQAKVIAVTKMVLRWAYANELIKTPVNFGSDLKVGRRARAAASVVSGKAFYAAEQSRALVAAAGVPLKAMILLALNGGYTQKEVAALTVAEVDLANAIIDHQRDKTGTERTVPLWPETVAAIQAALDARPKPKTPEAEPLVFVTRQGKAWHREAMQNTSPGGDGDDNPGNPGKMSRIDSVNLEFRKVLKAIGVKVEGAAFGKLRATHRIASDGANDLNAALRIMGHKVPGISRHYVKSIDRDRLVKVSEYVRLWLWPDLDKPTKPAKGKASPSKAKGGKRP